ncbi:UDP-3-O-(3-hydroxymyristoyl)glucosamine N-acyltransferase [Pantanalinema sp. GBBB05]|uniref:UDP-3-O-(3-hydroxymyristoyl)glucosamine N-acyltransferase n=1 Tax=Pantanalinema sp. GBBB05 TaxID=2604139 RepID=UPI001D1B3B59|nr:UDP-3-O-(3-hydroxymyristoyl)glucosamine N-acyltransferase [Pantanalinema sp. GBBB05]
MKFSHIVEQLSAMAGKPLQSQASQELELTGIAAVDQATPGTLSYIEGSKFAAQIQTTAASALILPQDATLQAAANDRGIAWVAAPEPRLMFAQAIALFYQPFRPAPEIHPTAVIDPSATIGEQVAIGAHVVIQAGVTIGNQVCIHPNVVIYPGVRIGDRSTLHANCSIHERTQIGTDCVIHSGVVLGAEGFGFVPTPQGWYKMQQSGYVVLEDRVEVGCNSTVDRPAVGETRIGQDTKIDNLVHVGHGCQIGRGCALAAQVGLAGGVEVGNRVILAGQVGVANNAKIGDGAIASSKSGVHGSVNPGQVVSGYPAVDHAIYLKSSAIYSRLPEMYQTLKQLKRQNQ